MHQAKMESWKAVPSASRSQTKSMLLKALTSNLAIARHTAAQAAAEVAAIELPFNEWPEFLPASSQHVASPNTPDGVKISTLECLGYTRQRVNDEEEAVARQAIEFGCALCEEEMDLQTPIARASAHYVEAELTHLVPLLLETMTKQDEDEDEDRWNVSMAAANCLCLVSNTVGDAVVAVVIPFAQQSMSDENN